MNSDSSDKPIVVNEPKLQKKQLRKKCIHKKRKSRCIECGGSSICIHKKQKADVVFFLYIF